MKSKTREICETVFNHLKDENAEDFAWSFSSITVHQIFLTKNLLRKTSIKSFMTPAVVFNSIDSI